MQSNNVKAGAAVWVRILAVVPAIFLMVMIFRFSMDTGTESSGLSTRVCAWLVDVVNRLFRRGWSSVEQATIAQTIEFFIRKCAHVTEYLILTLTYLLALRVTFRVSYSHVWWISFICTFVYACSDELHQRFVSGRSGQIRDVGIDCIGAVLAIGVVMLIHAIRVRAKRKRTLTNRNASEQK